MIVLIWTNQKSCQKNEEINNTLEIYQDTIVYLKDKNRYNEDIFVAKRRAWNNTNLKLEKVSSEKDSLLQRLKKISQKKGAITGSSFSTLDTVRIVGSVKYIEKWDTVYNNKLIADTVELFSNWYMGKLLLYPKKYDLSISFKNTFDVWVENIKPGLFKSKVPYVFVKSHNPHSHITAAQSFAPEININGFNFDIGGIWSSGIINAPGAYGEAYYDHNKFRVSLQYSYFNKNNSQLQLKAAYRLIKNL